MKSLDQIRAAHAVKFWQSEPGRNANKRAGADVAAHLPALVARSGLLATLALARMHGDVWESLMTETGRFLASSEVKLLPPIPATLDGFIGVLTNDRSDALLLQRATAEALSYLAFLKRLAPAVSGTE